jgi:ParB family chromosome partitioning protein
MKNTIIIALKDLVPFKGHPYKVEDNADMETLTESIRENGILNPLIVRPAENDPFRYEIISGHRRAHAARLAGIEQVPAFVYPISRDEAAVLVVDSNLHREHILPSEKAFAYKLKMEALKWQGRRTDLTSSQVATRLDTAAEIGAASNESRDQVFRYIRLTNLRPELLSMMDEGKIAFSVGVELSYLPIDAQYELLDAMARNDCTPSYAQAVRLHKAYNACKLDCLMIERTLAEPKPNQQEHIRLKRETFGRFFPDHYTAADIEQDILKGLELLKRQRDRSRDAR